VLAKRYGINQKTVAKWKTRASVTDLPTGPKEPHSTVLSLEDDAVIVAFRHHTLLPLDDCLYALQPTIPHLTRSSLHRCLRRHGVSRLPDVEGYKPEKKKFKSYPIGYFHIDVAEVQTAEGKLHLFVAIDWTSKFAFAQLVEKDGKDQRQHFAWILCLLWPRALPLSRKPTRRLTSMPVSENYGTRICARNLPAYPNVGRCRIESSAAYHATR
jgi:hypothetical protein